MMKQVSKPTTSDRRTTHSRGALPSKRNGKIGKALLIVLLGIIAIVILWVGITKSVVQQREKRQDMITENRLNRLNIELYNWLDSLGEFPTPDQVSPGLIEDLEQTCVIRWDALPENFRELREEQEKFREDQIEFPEDYANGENIPLPIRMDVETILVAYEKNTETEGGLVLFLDGTTEELTPEEFSPFLAAANERAERNETEAVDDD